jgi:centromere/kinetochore protein ZW10
MVLEAMEVVGILEYGLAKVADLMIKYVITPLINRGQPLSFLEESNQDSAVLKIVPSTET